MQVFTARQCCSLAADIHSFSRLTCKISRVNENLYFVIFPTDIVDAITGNGKNSCSNLLRYRSEGLKIKQEAIFTRKLFAVDAHDRTTS